MAIQKEIIQLRYNIKWCHKTFVVMAISKPFRGSCKSLLLLLLLLFDKRLDQTVARGDFWDIGTVHGYEYIWILPMGGRDYTMPLSNIE